MGTRSDVPRSRPKGTLRERLESAESTLRAIRAGEVDALVVEGPGGARTLTLDGAAHPYFVLLDAMSDGAVLLDRGGSILYANRSAGELAGRRPQELRDSQFEALAVPGQRPRLASLVQAASKRTVRGEFMLDGRAKPPTPVSVTLSKLRLPQASGMSGRARPVLMAIVTDLTSRRRAETVRRRLLERVMSAEEDERRRIARELHDETAQSLTAVLIGLRAITEMSDSDRSAVRAAARRVRRIAARTMDDVARLARGLHPAVLDDAGLAIAARRHAEDYARATGTTVRFAARHVDKPRLPPLVAATVYRILQEALTNVARHARASLIAVRLTRDASAVHLVVRDNGIGFSVAEGEAGERFGLHGMRERATLLGGAIEIESRPGRGTLVAARIPVSKLPPPRSGRKRARRTPPERPRAPVNR